MIYVAHVCVSVAISDTLCYTGQYQNREDIIMLEEPRTAFFTMTMDPDKKRRMEDFFENLGLTLTCGVNIFFEASVIQAKIPFDVKQENLTIPDMTDPQEQKETPKKSARFSMRMQPTRKRQVEYLYHELGMTVSQAVNMYFEACLHEWGIPFRVGYPKPGPELLAAMAETDLKDYDSYEDFLAEMEAEEDDE